MGAPASEMQGDFFFTTEIYSCKEKRLHLSRSIFLQGKKTSPLKKYILARKKDFTSQEVYSCKEKKLQLSRSVEARIDIGPHCFWTSNAAIKADLIMQLHAGYVIASSWNGLGLLKCCYSTCCCCSAS
jgi:hypothetical protein